MGLDPRTPDEERAQADLPPLKAIRGRGRVPTPGGGLKPALPRGWVLHHSCLSPVRGAGPQLPAAGPSETVTSRPGRLAGAVTVAAPRWLLVLVGLCFPGLPRPLSTACCRQAPYQVLPLPPWPSDPVAVMFYSCSCGQDAVFILSVSLVCSWRSGDPLSCPWCHPSRGPERPTDTATDEAVTSERGDRPRSRGQLGPGWQSRSGMSESEASCHLSLLHGGFHRSTDITAQDHF